MIRVWEYYSNGYGCNVSLGYQDGFLCSVNVDGPKQLEKNSVQFYNVESEFLNKCKEHKINVVERERVVTFEMFWDKYDYKISGKPQALKAWNKLSRLEQIEAYDFLPAYFAHLKLNNYNKKYAVTYLNQQPWVK